MGRLKNKMVLPQYIVAGVYDTRALTLLRSLRCVLRRVSVRVGVYARSGISIRTRACVP